MRLRLVAASCLLAAPVHAGEMEDDLLGEPMVEEEIELDQVEHEASAGYVASVTGAADAGGAAFGLATLGGDVAYTLSFGRERSQYEITIDAGASVSRMEGTVDATGASTRLHLALGPAPVPIGNKDLAHAAPFPLTFELDHEGELAAVPKLSDRPDVLRAPYLSQSIALATRIYMMEYSEDGIDEQQPWKEPGDRETGGAEAVPIRAAVKLTGQDGTRLEGTGAVGFFAARTDFPVAATVDCFLGEHHVVQLDDGDYGSTDTFWILRGAIDNPATGTGYEISWGFVLDQRAPAGRERKRDHTDHGDMVGALGLFSDAMLNIGYGAQYRHDAYVTMAGEPATEDRMFVEGWWEPDRTRLSARLFAARTKRELAEGPQISWTGGVELDARREVGLIAVGLHAEGGQSYYATLDGGAPTAELGARAALTLSRSARWVRGTR